MNRKSKRFVNVQIGKGADPKFAKSIERWVWAKFDELNAVHDLAVTGHAFLKVEWTK